MHHHYKYRNLSMDAKQLVPEMPVSYCPKAHLTECCYGVKRSTLPLMSSRWNPTRQQIEALEEMYRRGITTPTAEQIRQIASRLRKFGRIEGKNVFYWFQNHKARERQRKRRQIEQLLSAKKTDQVEAIQRALTGLSRSSMKAEKVKLLQSPSNCCTASEGSESMHAAGLSECVSVGKTQRQKQQQTVARKYEIRWQLDFSSCLSPKNSTAAEENPAQENANPSFLALNLSMSLPAENDDLKNLDFGIQETDRTLQLFPVRSINDCKIIDDSEKVSGTGTGFIPCEFFEFLPVKN